MNLSTEHDGLEACAYGRHLDVLRNLPLFSGVAPEALKLLAYLSRAETFAQGDPLAVEGQDAQAFYHIGAGRVLAGRQVGGNEVVVGEIGPGGSFGAMALIVEGKSLYTVRAQEPTTALTLGREAFAKTVERFPALLPALLTALAGHVLAWEEGFIRRRPEAFTALSREVRPGLVLENSSAPLTLFVNGQRQSNLSIPPCGLAGCKLCGYLIPSRAAPFSSRPISWASEGLRRWHRRINSRGGSKKG